VQDGLGTARGQAQRAPRKFTTWPSLPVGPAP